MAYTAIVASQVDADSPGDTTLMVQIKDNFIDHESRIGTVEAQLGNYTAGNYSLYKHPLNTIAALGASYAKVFEIKVVRAGTYRVRFGLYNSSTGSCFGRIYKNGVAFGTARSNTVDGTTVYYSEDLVFAAGDLIQIYAYEDGATDLDAVRDFELFVSSPYAGHTLNY